MSNIIERLLNRKKVFGNRYDNHIKRLKEKGYNTENIEETIKNSIKNLSEGKRSFIIYGEPQSGKTEMMEALTNKILDDQLFNIIIITLNDSLTLLEQNLARFCNVDPSPRKIKSIFFDKEEIFKKDQHVLFVKKNARDLEKLILKLEMAEKTIIVDDEADYASPNSKINMFSSIKHKREVSKMNELLTKLLEKRKIGGYIGVTATPSRLDLNNTLNNNHKHWVNFKPYEKYAGHRIFFPIENNLNEINKFRLQLLPEEHDDPKFLRLAIFRFLISSVKQNFLRKSNGKISRKWTMLIHTSGEKLGHVEDEKIVKKTLRILGNKKTKKHRQYLQEMIRVSELILKNENEENIEKIIGKILDKISQNNVIVMNSDKASSREDYAKVLEPDINGSRFNFAIGGNIISRGVTFQNLLSMFFSRGVKGKMGQSTYIQRARMFGRRILDGINYLDDFELTIPKNLYEQWRECFVHHNLALLLLENGKQATWSGSAKTTPVDNSSIDVENVYEGGGRGGGITNVFEITKEIKQIIENKNQDSVEKLKKISEFSGFDNIDILLKFILNFQKDEENSIVVHTEIQDALQYKDLDAENIKRESGGMISGRVIEKYPNARHHFILYKVRNKGKIYYRTSLGTLRFLTNTKNYNN